MTVLQSVLLGILQGIAEFLPISSSGHLQVVQTLFKIDEVPLLYDVMLHLATLLAVCIFFWKKIWSLLKCFGRWITRKPLQTQSDVSSSINEDDFLCGTEQRGRKTIIAIILSSAVTAVIGIVTSKIIPEVPVKVVCAGFIVTALLLIFSSIMEKRENSKALENTSSSADKNNEGISWKQSLFIGFMQGIGTLPGISRSGSTIAGAQLAKINRSSAGEYSFIVSIPAILGAFILEAKDLGEVSSQIGILQVIAGCVAAFVFGYLSLTFLMKLIKKGKLEWFACYLIPAGILGILFL